MGKRKHLSSESKTSSKHLSKGETNVNVPKKVKVENHDDKGILKKKKSDKSISSNTSSSSSATKKKKITTKKEPVFVLSPDEDEPYTADTLASAYKIKSEVVDSPSKSHSSKTNASKKSNTIQFSPSTTKIEDTLYDSHSDSEEAHSDEVVANMSESDIDVMQIPKRDLEVLLKHLEKCLPLNDNITYKTRAKRVKWDQVKFGPYSADQCQKMWDNIYKRLRPFKTFGDYVRDASVWLENPQQAFGKKTIMHPALPKRPKSAFFLYLADVKNDILQESEGVKMSDITRLAAIRYRTLSAQERKRYMDIAEKSMKKYDENMRKFYIEHPEMANQLAKYLGPKRPLTPFSIFLENHLRKDAVVDDKKDFKLAAKEVWLNLSSEKKVKWIREAMEAHNKYLVELEVYNSQHPAEPIKPIRSVISKDEKALLDEVEGKPRKPPNSAYLLFSQKMYNNDNFAEMDTKVRMKLIAEKWKMLDAVEKAKYENKLNKARLRYNEDYQKYLKSLPEYERVKLETIELNKKKTTEAKRRKSVTERVTKQSGILPKNWTQLSEEEQKRYFTALEKINDFFEGNMGDLSKVKEDDDNDSEVEEEKEEESEDDTSSDDD